MRPVINYDLYRRRLVENKHPDGFWFDQDQFENLIDAWCTKEEVITILQTSEKELDKFCKICYNETFDTTFRVLLSISRMFMKKTYSTLAAEGNTTAIGITAKHFLGLKDDEQQQNMNITIRNDLKRDDED